MGGESEWAALQPPLLPLLSCLYARPQPQSLSDTALNKRLKKHPTAKALAVTLNQVVVVAVKTAVA